MNNFRTKAHLILYKSFTYQHAAEGRHRVVDRRCISEEVMRGNIWQNFHASVMNRILTFPGKLLVMFLLEWGNNWFWGSFACLFFHFKLLGYQKEIVIQIHILHAVFVEHQYR